MTICYHQELKGLPKTLGFCMDIKSLLVGKSFPMQNFANQGKILPWGKLPWRGKIFASEIIPYSRKNHCLWKTSLIKGTSVLLENFPDQGNIFASGKNFPCWKLIDQGKYVACVKFFACGQFPWSRKNLCAKILWSWKNNLCKSS